MNKTVTNVATGYYVRGQNRLRNCLEQQGVDLMAWANEMPPGSPTHEAVPYAFKAWALKRAHETTGAKLLLWADASVEPIRSMEPLWEKIESEGVWISNNGWRNSEWTAEMAYADLPVGQEENALIPHVCATVFGVNLDHEIGRQVFDEYLRLAETRAFCGPWWNSNHPQNASREIRKGWCEPCGGSNVLGHRHDQTALSIIAWQAGVELTDPPAWLAYSPHETDKTIFSINGNYLT